MRTPSKMLRQLSATVGTSRKLTPQELEATLKALAVTLAHTYLVGVGLPPDPARIGSLASRILESADAWTQEPAIGFRAARDVSMVGAER